MNVKQLILLASLISMPALKAENPFEHIQGDLTEEQALEIIQHESFHEHVDTMDITISINRNIEKEEVTWEKIVKRAISFSKKCHDEGKNFPLSEFSDFVKETCEDLMKSDLRGKAFIRLFNKSEENENNVEVGYEKS